VSPTAEDKIFNKENSNYLLVVRPLITGYFQTQWHLSDFSNAAAILLLPREFKGTFFTHLGNYFRELGMPVLASIGASFSLSSLEKRQDEKIKFLIYVNEFKQEGFVATV
jgi:hypothetical protein